MPAITIKTEYIDKLKSLGAYDKWMYNVKSQHDIGINSYGASTFAGFINSSLGWDDTLEGHAFWKDIAHKFDD